MTWMRYDSERAASLSGGSHRAQILRSWGTRVQGRSQERVDEICADLAAAGYRGQQPPFDAFWGARHAVIEDPDRNAVGIMSLVDPDRRSHTDFGET